MKKPPNVAAFQSLRSGAGEGVRTLDPIGKSESVTGFVRRPRRVSDRQSETVFSPRTPEECPRGVPLCTGVGEAPLKPRSRDPLQRGTTNLTNALKLFSVPGAIRTHGPKIRNLVLYPAELRGHC
jgi:hypothetical protein